MPPRRRAPAKPASQHLAEPYTHYDTEALARPDAGMQATFRKRKPPKSYRYDPTLDPELSWTESNVDAEVAKLWDRAVNATTLEESQTALRQLNQIAAPQLRWAGKAERPEFAVPTLPLFVHERLSTKAILESLRGHKRDKQMSFDLYGDDQLPIADRALQAYEHKDRWVNRLILGDSLQVMNSLLEYESMGGQVQMIYMDPPYGVKFGSNFQPFVRKRDVKPTDDADMTREPEMVKAYRDTWELGLHSYLAYLRDRLHVARRLLNASGSAFVQISEDNLHSVSQVMDEIFGRDNLVSVIPFRKKTMPLGAKHLESICDYLLWYAKDKDHLKYRQLYTAMDVQGDTHWNYVELTDGTRRKMTGEEIADHSRLPVGSIPARLMGLYPVGINRTGLFPVPFRGRTYTPSPGNSWFTSPAGMQRLIDENRIEPYEDGQTLNYFLKLSDSPTSQLTNLWSDTSAPPKKLYTVQTSPKVIERCLLMATEPGDLVLDPTCGGGTTAVTAERWGRRWITVDTSRVPVALSRQRLLTQTYPYYRLKDNAAGPTDGFVFEHHVNARGQQTGGIIKVTTRGSIANDELAEEVVLVDKPELDGAITRVTGPFVIEATIPNPVDLKGSEEADGAKAADPNGAVTNDYFERMFETLRKAPRVALGGNAFVEFRDVRIPARSLTLSAEATVEEATVAIVFGPCSPP